MMSHKVCHDVIALSHTLRPIRYLIQEGREGSPKMMSVGLHCRLARPGRVSGISDFIDFAKSYGKDVWICTREEIADFWYENHSPIGAGSPVKPADVVEDSKAESDEGEKDDGKEIAEKTNGFHVVEEDGDII